MCGRPRTASFRSSTADASASGSRASSTSSLIWPPNRWYTTASGACPLRKPGIDAFFA